MSGFLLTQQGSDHSTRSLVPPLVRVADGSDDDGVNFHHWPEHRHLGERGWNKGRGDDAHRHLEAGGRTAGWEFKEITVIKD